jgi:hypothetical protein
MAAEHRHLPEQEQSIKARERELFVKPSQDEANKPVRPFAEYLRETPAIPLTATTKVVLWMVAIVVAMLFLAAIARLVLRHGGPQRGTRAEPAARTAQASMFGARDAPGVWIF